MWYKATEHDATLLHQKDPRIDPRDQHDFAAIHMDEMCLTGDGSPMLRTISLVDRVFRSQGPLFESRDFWPKSIIP